MFQGEYRDLVVGVTGSDGSAFDLTGTSIVWILEENPKSGSLVRKHGIGSSAASGLTISTSTITISLSPADTLNLAGNYYHEAEAKDSSSRVSTLFVGQIKIRESGANV